jgi:hypothetical protein
MNKKNLKKEINNRFLINVGVIYIFVIQNLFNVTINDWFWKGYWAISK